jgi:hypothetical protein
MNSIGFKTGWRVIQGSPDFFRALILRIRAAPQYSRDM